MSDVVYGIREEIYELQGDRRVSYGIVVYDNTDGENTYTVLESIGDITSDKNKLIRLVEECNISELSPIHLKEIIEDFMLE